MKIDPLLAGKCADLINRFDRAYLIICIHDRDEHCLVGNRALQVLEVHETISIDGKIGDFIPVLLERLA